MRHFFIIIFVILSLTGYGQSSDSISDLFIRIDLAPRWVWRGVSYSEGPVIQPSFGISGKKITAFIWGSYAINKNEYQEIDFVVEYSPVEQLKIGFTDYFGIPDQSKNDQHFYDLRQKTTMHVFDLYASVKPFKKVPLTFLWSTWFYGADKDTTTQKQFYSSYIELLYEKQFKTFGVQAFCGGTPYKSFYYHKEGVVNLGLAVTKNYSLGNTLTLPVKVEFILNPSTQNVYVNAVIGIR